MGDGAPLRKVFAHWTVLRPHFLGAPSPCPTHNERHMPRHSTLHSKVRIPVLFLLVAMINLPLFLRAFALTQSDSTYNGLLSHEFLEGHFKVFPSTQSYGGTAWTLIRTAWILLWGTLPSLSAYDWQAQMLFDYILMPWVFMSIAYLLMTPLALPMKSVELTLFLVGIGFSGSISIYGNDFYVGSIVFASLALYLRKESSHPIRELPERSLILMGALSGLALYCWRGSVPILVAAFAPITMESLKNFLKAPLWRWRRVLLSICIGLLPEIIEHTRRPPAGLFTYSSHSNLFENIASSFQNALKLPQALLSYATGFPVQGNTLISLIACCFLITGLMSIFTEAKKNKAARPFVILLFAGIAGYILIHNYASGAPRYLSPLLPAIFTGFTILSQRLFTHGKKNWAIAGLLSTWLLHQGIIRTQLFFQPQLNEKTQSVLPIIEKFKNNGVRIVLSDDYWNTNSYSIYSNRTVDFVGPGRPHHAERSLEWAQNDSRVGVLSHHEGYSPPGYTITEKLGTISNLSLAIAERLPSRAPGR